MAVAEIFLTAFITVLFEKLASGDLIRLARSAGIYSELNKWYDTLTQIRAVLIDAGHKHVKDEAVQTWLNKLQHLAYEIDDVLDDLATEAMRRQLNQETSASTSRSKVLTFIPTKFHAFKYGRKMSSKLEAITNELRELVEKINLLGLIRDVERPKRESQRLEQTSLVDESEIVGRKGDKEALLGKLLGNESSSQNVSVVSIVGMGGIGKTTLARILYNDQKVKDHFGLKSWVCVSDDFDVFNISKAIYQAVGGANQDFANLNLLQVALSDKLSKQKFLIVLDDVWNEIYDDWEILQRPFGSGAPGSKVLVTTRKAKVASVMDSVQAYSLEILSNEEAVSLFAKHALGKPNFNSHPMLKPHGEGIVKKCGGLPLALRTLGRVLRTKSSSEEWEELLNSEIWNLKSKNQILPALRLSYYDLPPHLKQMFVYCCLFPKDYMFNKNELVLLWMAEGFLYDSNHKSMESLGQECFEELVLRSFFQHSSTDKSRYVMHDLINDLAMSVAWEFFIIWDDKVDAFDRNEGLEKYRYLSFIRETYGVYRKFKALERARRLRTFFPVSLERLGHGWNYYQLSNTVLLKLIPKLQLLRVLSLNNYRINEIPESIGRLKHLRYLNFSNTNITCLPAQVVELYNLQSLLLSGCNWLSSLPNSLVKLINLRHLDISDTPKLDKMPLGIGGLTGLQTLSKVIIGGANEFKISDLKGLLHLQGQLSIEGLDKVKDVVQIKEANLQQKKGLRDLEMKWSHDSRDEITYYEVLESLRPFEKLTSLKIMYYKGTKFPSWVGDPSFDCLTQLTLHGCTGCTCLPALGCLPSLQALVVKSMNGLKRVGSELLRPTDSSHGVAFRSLEVLKFEGMMGWEEWSSNGSNKDETAGSFPRLQDISLINCPKLHVVAIELMPSLRICSIEGCLVEVLTSMVRLSSSIVSLTLKKISGLTHLHGEILEHLGGLNDLSISWCDELTYLWESEAHACDIVKKLKKLEVSRCKNLVSLKGKKMDLMVSMESITEVEIEYCPRLESYNCPNHIEELIIKACDSIASLTFPRVHEHDHLPSTLKFFEIKGCDNLEMSWLPNNFLSSSLESLRIRKMSNLMLFPEGCFVHLADLIIDDCDNIESIPVNGFPCLRYLWISNCRNLKSFHHEHLQSLTSLKVIDIRSCPSMDDSFPCGKWPPNLSSLSIGGLKKPISEWGMQNFPTSLVTLYLSGEDSGVVSFAKAEEEEMRNTSTCSSSFLLPSSLTSLWMSYFMELESVSKGLQHLTCLQHLSIDVCPKLKDLPETLLPSLSSLWLISPSPELSKRCKRRKGKYWPIISQIPELNILIQ